MTFADIHAEISVNDKKIDLPNLNILKGVTLNCTYNKTSLLII